MNPSSWPSYLKRTMKDAVFATEEAFQKVIKVSIIKSVTKFVPICIRGNQLPNLITTNHA